MSAVVNVVRNGWLGLGRRGVPVDRNRTERGVVTVAAVKIAGMRRWRAELGEEAQAALGEFRESIVEEILSRFGWAWRLSRPGDATLVVFTRPSDAVRFALEYHARFRAAARGAAHPLAARVGIDVGEAVLSRNNDGRAVTDAVGGPVETAVRIASAARGGQTLMTGGVFRNAVEVLRGQRIPGLRPIAWVNHGTYRLMGVEEDVELCEAGEHGPAPLSAPSLTA